MRFLRSRVLLLMLLAAAAAGLWWQHQELKKARTLKEGIEPARPESITPAEMVESENTREQKDEADLLRLRNEVHQLRAEKAETQVANAKTIEKLQRENGELHRAVESMQLQRTPRPPVAVSEPGVWIGVTIGPFEDQTRQIVGTAVQQVADDSPASKAGIKPGDIILAVNGKKVTSAVELRSEIAAHTAGQNAVLDVLREGIAQQLIVIPAERPK